MYQYKARITRVIDGDTYEADIDLGLKVHVHETVRLFEHDTPETHRPKTEAERKHGEQATAFVRNLIEGKQVVIETFKDKQGKYGRWLAKVFYPASDGSYQPLGYALSEHGLLKREHYSDGG